MVEACTERVCMDCGKYMPFVAVHSGAMQQVSVNHKKVWMQPKKMKIRKIKSSIHTYVLYLLYYVEWNTHNAVADT